MGFIYKVTNTTNGKLYIGKTIRDVQGRFQEHLREAYAKNFHRPFHDAIRKYGPENFSVETIEEVSYNEIDIREQYWIEYYRSYIGFNDSNGYNATLGGDGTVKLDYKAIVDDYLVTKNKQETADRLGICHSSVTNACEEYKIQTFSNISGRPIIRTDDNGEEKIFSTIRQAAEEIANSTNKNADTIRKRITFVVNHKQNQKAYGFFWKTVN